MEGPTPRQRPCHSHDLSFRLRKTVRGHRRRRPPQNLRRISVRRSRRLRAAVKFLAFVVAACLPQAGSSDRFFFFLILVAGGLFSGSTTACNIPQGFEDRLIAERAA